jgi:hypothetical protein
MYFCDFYSQLVLPTPINFSPGCLYQPKPKIKKIEKLPRDSRALPASPYLIPSSSPPPIDLILSFPLSFSPPPPPPFSSPSSGPFPSPPPPPSSDSVDSGQWLGSRSGSGSGMGGGARPGGLPSARSDGRGGRRAAGAAGGSCCFVIF